MEKYLSLILIVTFFSCSVKEKDIEAENIEIFHKIKPELQNSISHIKEKYLTNKGLTSKSVYSIIPAGKDGIRKNIYYDKLLGEKLLKYDILTIQLSNNSDCKTDIFPDIFFKILAKSNNQYYYTYHFCNTKYEKNESQNYKVIPLDEKWNLEIEKN